MLNKGIKLIDTKQTWIMFKPPRLKKIKKECILQAPYVPFSVGQLYGQPGASYPCVVPHSQHPCYDTYPPPQPAYCEWWRNSAPVRWTPALAWPASVCTAE